MVEVKKKRKFGGGKGKREEKPIEEKKKSRLPKKDELLPLTRTEQEKFSDLVKTYRANGRTKVVETFYNFMHNTDYNIDDIANDQTKTPFERGVARFCIRWMEQADAKDLQEIQKIYSLMAERAEKDDSEGNYIEFLMMLAAGRVKKS